MEFKYKQNVTQKPVAVTNQEIQVVLQPEELLNDYSRNFVSEGERKHVLLAQTVQLTPEEVQEYARYLLYARVQQVHGELKNYRMMQLLFVPVWIEYTISNIGVLIIKELGLTFIPTMEASTMTYGEAKIISDKIRMFDGVLQVTDHAFPNEREGDADLMTTAVIADYVRSTKELMHPVTTYLTAFLGMKIREENAFSVLYRIQYDDISYLQRALDSEREVIC